MRGSAQANKIERGVDIGREKKQRQLAMLDKRFADFEARMAKMIATTPKH